MMALLPALDTASSTQVPRSHGVNVVYEFFKHTTIPAVESELDLCTNILGTGDRSDTFQDDRPKTIIYAIMLSYIFYTENIMHSVH